MGYLGEAENKKHSVRLRPQEKKKKKSVRLRSQEKKEKICQAATSRRRKKLGSALKKKHLAGSALKKKKIVRQRPQRALERILAGAMWNTEEGGKKNRCGA